MIDRVYYLGPNHKLAVSFLQQAALFNRNQRVRVAEQWQRQRSWSRDEYIDAALHKAITAGRFLHLVNVGNIISANRSLYALDPAGAVLLDDELEFVNGIWIWALEKVTKILVISDLLSEELVTVEIESFTQAMTKINR